MSGQEGAVFYAMEIDLLIKYSAPRKRESGLLPRIFYYHTRHIGSKQH